METSIEDIIRRIVREELERSRKQAAAADAIADAKSIPWLNPEMKAALTAEMVSKRFGIAMSTLANWRFLTHQGEPTGPRFVKVGRLVRYLEHDLNEWIENQQSG